MNCLNPFTRRYLDAITGETKECLCPCGKCINCLHSEQDAWCIRLGETAKASKCMIYDTLTLSPYAIHSIDILRPTSDGRFYGTSVKWRNWKVQSIKKKYSRAREIFPKMSLESWKMFKKSDFKLYSFPKKEVQNWIKRGRQMYFRDKGHRCDISYFIVQEYGPQTSRPHFHLLMFGLNFSDYSHYFGNCWREDFGWTKPSYFVYTPSSRKDFTCITRYVSKYVSKGSFESPWVADGFLSKPYRLISKGIGEGYLNKDYFDVFKDERLTKYQSIHCPSQKSFETNLEKLVKEGNQEKVDDYIAYFKSHRFDVDNALNSKDNGRSYIDLSHITDSQFEKLRLYYDEGGYPHKLPLYYRNKILRGKSNEKNIYQFEVQNVLQQSACLYDNQVVQQEAAQLGIRIPDEWLPEPRSTWKLSTSEAFMVDYQHLLNQRCQAKVVAERRKVRLTNFYNRSAQNLEAPALL